MARTKSARSPNACADSLKRISKDSPALRDALQHAIGSETRPLPLPRTHADLSASLRRLNWNDTHSLVDKQLLTLSNCHMGQTKLALGMLDFVAETIRKHKYGEARIVLAVAGASGVACSVVHAAFPKVMVVGFDPDSESMLRTVPSAVARVADVVDRVADADPSKNLIFVKSEFGQQEVEFFKARSFRDRDKLLLYSDIRSSFDDVSAVNDMLLQQSWVRATLCDHFFLKFKLPVQANVRARPGVMEKFGEQWPGFKAGSPGEVAYLAGELHIQAYAPQNSTELRLLGSKQSDGRYGRGAYNVEEIAELMMTFNTAYRSHATYAHRPPGSRKRKTSLGFDRACQEQILCRAAEASETVSAQSLAVTLVAYLKETGGFKDPGVCEAISAVNKTWPVVEKGTVPAAVAEHVTKCSEANLARMTERQRDKYAQWKALAQKRGGGSEPDRDEARRAPRAAAVLLLFAASGLAVLSP